MGLHHKFKHIYHKHHILRIHPHQSTKLHLDNQVDFFIHNHQSTQVKIEIIFRLTRYLKNYLYPRFCTAARLRTDDELAASWLLKTRSFKNSFWKIIEYKQSFIECIYNFIYILEVPEISWYSSIGFSSICMYFQFEKPNQI